MKRDFLAILIYGIKVAFIVNALMVLASWVIGPVTLVIVGGALLAIMHGHRRRPQRRQSQ